MEDMKKEIIAKIKISNKFIMINWLKAALVDTRSFSRFIGQNQMSHIFKYLLIHKLYSDNMAEENVSETTNHQSCTHVGCTHVGCTHQDCTHQDCGHQGCPNSVTTNK